MIRITTAAVLALAGTALAQYEITIDVENPVLRPGESTTVTLLGGYGGTDYAVAGLATNFITSVGSEGWSDADLVHPMGFVGTSPGVPSPTGYDGIIAGQFQDGLHFYADPTNPIAFWTVTYTAPLDASAPFDIDLSTMTTKYDVYLSRESATSASRLADLVEGSGTIRVIPAPASALVLAGGIIAMRRRR
jgi:hypothetical protein